MNCVRCKEDLEDNKFYWEPGSKKMTLKNKKCISCLNIEKKEKRQEKKREREKYSFF